MDKLYKKLGGRKLVAGIVSALVVIANDYYNLGLSPVEVILALSNLTAFIGVEGAADLFERKELAKQVDYLQKLSDKFVDEDKKDGDNS